MNIFWLFLPQQWAIIKSSSLDSSECRVDWIVNSVESLTPGQHTRLCHALQRYPDTPAQVSFWLLPPSPHSSVHTSKLGIRRVSRDGRGTGYWVPPRASRRCTAVLGRVYTHTTWTNSVWFETSEGEELAQVSLWLCEDVAKVLNEKSW